MYAPNITVLIPKYSDARPRAAAPPRACRRDGRQFWGMPSKSSSILSDADMNALIAYLRTLKPAGKATAAVQVQQRRAEGR